MKSRTTISAAVVAVLALTGAQGGCGPSGTHAKPGHTLVVPGATEETVTCNETPYDVVLDAKEHDGSGIVISRGFVRGAMWVSCTGPGPDTFEISVQLLRNGLPYGDEPGFTAIPNAVGYFAGVFTKCVPGVYRLQYRYRWTLQGGVQADTNTAATNEVVTQHDCDA